MNERAQSRSHLNTNSLRISDSFEAFTVSGFESE